MMRALMFEAPGQVAFRDVPAPTLDSDGAALVRPVTVATCDLDAHVVRGMPGFDPPFVLGHEFVAEIIEVGGAVVNHRAGDVVAVSYQPSCGHCRMCGRGVSSGCRTVPRTSNYGLGALGGNWGGAYADVVLVPYADFMLAAIPEGVSLRQACNASDNAADAYRCVAPALERDPGAPVLIVGNGSIPVVAADCARRLGAERVSIYAQDPQVLGRAEAVGADVFEVGAWPDRFPTHPITVDCTSDAAGLRSVVTSTEAGGMCVASGMHFADVPLPMLAMYMKGITLVTGRTQGASDLARMLDAMAAGQLDPLVVDPLVTAWDDLPDALRAGALKVIAER